MKTAEEYSHTDEGGLYTFSWIFPIENYIKGSVGLSTKSMDRNLQTYAHLDDKEISAIITSELKDHPILLIPINVRQKLIDDALKDDLEVLEIVKKSYLYNGDLAKKNRMIFDALLKNYKGDYTEVLKHIRVERFFIDKRYSIGAATIEPQVHVDARLQQITMDKRLASLPPSLQSLNLFSMNGEVVLGNRGILEFSDLLKRPLDAFKYLLMTMESKTVNLQGILTELDIFFIGSSNEVHFSAFKQHPDFNSFKGRFNFIRVPYLMKYTEEKKIYKEQLNNIKEKAVFEPHSLRILCLWAVMTRYRAPLSKNYRDTRLGKIVSNLNPIQKALLISDGTTPEELDSESKQILKKGINRILTEYQNDGLYEGKFGISPREIKQIIYEISSRHHLVTFVEVLELLKELSDKKMEYDFLNIAPQGDYHNPKKFIELLEKYALDLFDYEVRDSLGLVDERSYEDYISKYIVNINALIKGEKIKNKVTAKYEPSDMYFIKEFESNINLKESPEKFRSHLISRLGAYYLDNPGKGIVYSDVFDDIVKLLQESFIKEQKKIIDKVAKNLMYYLRELEDSEDGKTETKSVQLNSESRAKIRGIISNLMEKFDYSEKGAINTLKYLIKKRY
jgi:serine protein kinase